MKLVKKILRLLPIIYLIFVFLCIILSYNQKIDYQNFDIFLQNIDFGSGVWDNLIEYNFINLVPNDIYNWFLAVFNQNYFLDISLGVLFYELYLSIAYIIFDVINLVYTWANKFINKGVDLE